MEIIEGVDRRYRQPARPDDVCMYAEVECQKMTHQIIVSRHGRSMGSCIMAAILARRLCQQLYSCEDRHFSLHAYAARPACEIARILLRCLLYSHRHNMCIKMRGKKKNI